MVFRFTRRQDQPDAPRHRSRFRQSTALIGATLLFCLAGVGAEADTLYYNFGNTGGTPNPSSTTPGGNWSTSTSDVNWVERFNNGNYDSVNVDFDNNDDVHFLTTGSTAIQIEINGEVEPDEIVVEQGEFVFKDTAGSVGTITGNSLQILADGVLASNVDMTISDAVSVAGELTVGSNTTLIAESDVVVSGSGILSVDGKITGGVTIGSNATINFGAGSLISDTLTFDGTVFNGAGHVGGLKIESDAIVTFAGANAVVDLIVDSDGQLTLGEGTFNGRLINIGVLTLTDDVAFEDSDATAAIDGLNRTGGTIVASGGARTLSFVQNFTNDGNLQGGSAGSSLTIEAASLRLLRNTAISGTVTLSGAISNAANLDLRHVPVLEAAFDNVAAVGNAPAGTATVTSDVDGNGQVFTNAGRLRVLGGNLTGLASLTNTNTIEVAAGQTLGAETIDHDSGTLTSLGTLQGKITSSATAEIEGVIDGSLDVADGVTTITGTLDLSSSANGGSIKIGEDGRMIVAEGTTVITGLLTNDGGLDLGTVVSGTPDVVIDGDLVNSGLLTGEGRISGNLTFSGDSDTEFTGTLLSVDGALINDLDGAAQLSDFAGITYDELRNLGNLTIGNAGPNVPAVTADVVNLTGGTLTVNGMIGGDLTSSGQTALNNDVNGQLQVLAGVATVGVKAGGGAVQVGGSAGSELTIDGTGALLVSGGSLTSTGAVQANGRIRVSQGQTLTTSRLTVAGQNQSWIRGTVAGEVATQGAGTLELDGAIVTNRVLNSGILTDVVTTARSARLQGGLQNSGEVYLDSAAYPVIITRILRNEETGYAEIVGNVVADGALAASVTNLGELHLTGNVAGSIDNSKILDLTGNATSLTNNQGANATVAGTIGVAGTPAAVDVINRGTLNLTGSIANSLQNLGLGIATVNATIGGNAINTRTLNLAGDVALQIQNNGANARLNIIGDTQATSLVSSGTVNIGTGHSLDLTSGQLTNTTGAVLNVAGTIETSAVSGVLAVQNDAGATLNVVGSGTVSGNLGNSGIAGIAGTVTGDLANAASGNLTLRDGAEIGGTLTNQGQTLVVAGATATVNGGTTNQDDLEIRGTLESTVVNAADATLELVGGTIIGAVTNQAGAAITSSGTIEGNVLNAGTFTVDLFSRVEGNFTNNNLLTQSTNNSRIVVSDTFVNNGTISTGAFSDMTISAATYINNGVTSGNIHIDADIGNVNQLIYNADSDLSGNLSNQDNGVVRVWATVTGDGDNIVSNDGVFEVARGGELLNVDTITNRDQFTIASGSRVQANEVINASGTLSNDGRIEADVTNRAGAELISTRTIIGNLTNAGDATLAGALQGALTTTATGETIVSGALSVSGPLRNDGTMQVASDATLTSAQTVVNGTTGTLTANGAIIGNVLNSGVAQILGGLTGNLTNAGEALVSGTVTGALVNNGADATTTLRVRDSLQAGSVNNESGTLVVGAGSTLTVEDRFQNSGDGTLVVAGVVHLGSDQPLLNTSSRGMTLLASSTLNGDLQNEGRANLAGTINGSVLNRSDATGAGVIGGGLTNEGDTFATGGDLLVRGAVINRRATASGAAPQPGAPQLGPGDPATLRVNANTALTATGGVTNDEFSTVEVNGTLNGTVTNRGEFNLTNRLNGSLVTTGTAALAGEITRDVIFRGGNVALTGDLTVGGTFDAFDDFTVASGQTLTANLYNNRADQRLTVNGQLAGAVNNFGAITAGNNASIEDLLNEGTVLIGRAMTVRGSLTNNGRMEMADGVTGDVLNINGAVSGTGVYALDLDLVGNAGAGASDQIVVRGGAVTGSILLSFDAVDIETPSDESRRVLVFDVDGSQGAANSFTFAAEGLPDTSERIVYALVRDGSTGDLYVSDTINPALGALAGNLALTQSLIGSVVNRPTSPFVPGLATDAGAEKCGYGAWARAVAGHASATGQSFSGDVSANSEIEANYRGLQFGGDLACFENSVHGWNLAFGVLGGVNDGTTTQPVYINNSTNASNLGGLLTSINHGDFRQIYGGVYATATRDRLSLDLQVRRERTNFTIDNQPVGSNEGLQLENPEFDSNATTISGSVSYAYALPKEGWMFLPTAGFAFSNLTVDEIKFATGDTLQIKDSQNRVGFAGATLSRTFINEAKNSAIYAFGTATIYKDFASDTRSVYTMIGADGSVIRTDELSSSNLGTYGELSLGANYLKVLDTGRAGAPRQFNASIRVDGRTGDVLDSYGVTAQVRFQF